MVHPFNYVRTYFSIIPNTVQSVNRRATATGFSPVADGLFCRILLFLDLCLCKLKGFFELCILGNIKLGDF